MDLWLILGDIVLLLAASLVFGAVLSRLGQSPLVGYLLAGMLLGGVGSIQAIDSQREIETIAELGVALLLFSLGLEFSVARLKEQGFRALAGGSAQVVLTAVLGAGCASLFGLGVKASIAFGAMVSLSSTAVVLRMLMERGELEMPHGRNSLVVLLVQDMAVVPLALLMALLGSEGGGDGVAHQVGRLLLMALLLVLGLFLLTKVAVRVLGTLTLLRNRELTFIFAAVTSLGAAWAAHGVGLSPALGAFVAGMLLGSSPFATQIRADIASLRMVFLTLFFGAAGMVADLVWIAGHWHWVIGVTALLVVGKMAVVWLVFLILGHGTRVSAATGLCLAQIGEFAFVLGTIGRANGVVSHDMYTLVVSATIASFIICAALVPLAPRFGHFAASLFGSKPAAEGEGSATQHDPDVVVIGFGPAGQVAARPFVGTDKRVVVIDLNREGVRRARECGFEGMVGDATQNDVLEHAQLGAANVVVITVPDHRSGLDILEHVRQLAPHAHVVVRSRYKIHSQSFVDVGAHVVVGDEEQAGECLAEHIQQWLAESEHRRVE